MGDAGIPGFTGDDPKGEEGCCVPNALAFPPNGDDGAGIPCFVGAGPNGDEGFCCPDELAFPPNGDVGKAPAGFVA